LISTPSCTPGGKAEWREKGHETTRSGRLQQTRKRKALVPEREAA
jgi:hypothetical protein